MRLGKTLSAYQQKHDIDGRKLAAEIGISESTLTRVKQGKMPDAVNFAKIMIWLVNRP